MQISNGVEAWEREKIRRDTSGTSNPLIEVIPAMKGVGDSMTLCSCSGSKGMYIPHHFIGDKNNDAA